MPFGRRSVQANKGLVRGAPGLVYFGSLLGVGVLTDMSTPLVWAGLVYSATAGAAAIPYGLGFGLGRSVPALAAVLVGELADYHAVAHTMLIELPGRLRPVGVLAAAIGLAVAVARLLTLG